MDEYVEREKVLSKAAPVEGCFSDMISAYDVILLPAADVAPVRHGYWRPILHVGGKTDYECSCCLGIIADVPDDDEHDLCAWCSMCGAKMDGGIENAVD